MCCVYLYALHHISRVFGSEAQCCGGLQEGYKAGFYVKVMFRIKEKGSWSFLKASLSTPHTPAC